MSNEQQGGALFVLSGPSGVGKTSVIHACMKRMEGLRFSISTTTRAVRSGEVDGRDYHFVTEKEFDRMVEKDQFLEWAIVHGHRYGTARASVQEWRDSGLDVILDIDVQGARQVKERCPESIQVLLLPPSFTVLRERLVGRSSDRAEAIRRRLSIARDEILQAEHYQYVIINAELHSAADKLVALIRTARLRTPRMRGRIRGILDTF